MGTQASVPYLTTRDSLVEFNLVNTYKIYDNLTMNLELDYLVNCMDNSTWKKANTSSSFEKQDMWKAQVTFAIQLLSRSLNRLGRFDTHSRGPSGLPFCTVCSGAIPTRGTF